MNRKIISLFMAVLILLSSFSVGITAFGEGIKTTETFNVVSDLHFFAPGEMGNKGVEWQNYSRNESKEYTESEIIIKAALNTIIERAKKNRSKYVLIPGDLTSNGEYANHVAVAKILEDFEKESGIQVLVVPGNHDIQNIKAVTFKNDKMESAPTVSAEQFREIYKNLGYDLAFDEYKPKTGYANGLSYVANMGDNFALIAIDSNIYENAPRYTNTNGRVTDEFMKWVKEKSAEIISGGRTPIVMVHHGLSPHMRIEPSVVNAFPLDNYMPVAEKLLSYGINFAFTGHLHTSDISSVTDDNGNVLYDCESASLTGFPNTYNEVTAVKYISGKTELNYIPVDADDKCKIVLDGVTYDYNTFKKKSFALCFGGATSVGGNPDVPEFASGLVKAFALPYVEQIKSAGGISPFLKKMGFDIKKILTDFLKPYIGEGIYIGGKKIFSVDNLMWFVDDLIAQVENLYLNNTDNLVDLATYVVSSLSDIKMSDIPCTKFIEKYGFGDKTKPGTFEDLALSMITYWYEGNEDISDDKFMQDVLNNLKDEEYLENFINNILDVVIDDLALENILGKLDIRVTKIFGDSKAEKLFGDGLDYLLSKVLKNNYSYKNLVDTVFALGILPYDNVREALLGYFLGNFLNDDEMEKISTTVVYLISDFCTDVNPKEKGDFDVTYSNEKVKVDPTKESMQLPTMLNVCLGKSAGTRVISWYSKYSLTPSDIEIHEMKSGIPVIFTGKATTGSNIVPTSVTVTKSYPGVDLGYITLMDYSFDTVHHTVTVSGLESGKKYAFRVGNEEKGWWSETGTIEIEDGGKDVSFIHTSYSRTLTDNQAKKIWANTITKASEKTNSDFILNTGDFTETGKDIYAWQRMFDSPESVLLNTPMMPAFGSREAGEKDAFKNNFALSDLTDKNLLYYSFDFNNVHVTVLNSLNLNNTQIEWMKKDITSSTKKWKIVSVYNSSLLDENILTSLGVDLVLSSGQYNIVNNNTVSDYLKYNSKTFKTYDNGKTVFLSSGLSGIDDEKDCGQGYSIIEIKDGVLYVETYSVNGEKESLTDCFALRKDITQGEKTSAPEVTPETETTSEKFIDKLIRILSKIIRVIIKTFVWYF